MIGPVLNIDHNLLTWINQTATHPWLDLFFSLITNLQNIPLVQWVIFPLLFGWWVFRQRQKALKIFLACLITVACCDLVAYRGIKGLVQRTRPFTTDGNVIVRVDHWPRSPSFPSNHAVSMGGLAVVASAFYPQLRWVFWLIAIVIAYSRVYVGVHFPSDAFLGLILGALIGSLIKRGIARLPFFKSALSSGGSSDSKNTARSAPHQ